MANIAKIELGDTTYDIKDAVVRPKIDAITAEDTDGNTYVKTSQLTVDGNSTLHGAITADSTFNAGDTVTSGATADNGIAFKIQSARIDRDTTNSISTDIWGPRLHYVDKDDESIGSIQTYQRTNGNIGLRMMAWSENTDGESVWNTLGVEIARDGTPSYSISNPTNFRTAINAAASSHTHAANDITSGTLGVARGGTGASTLGAGVVYHSASGTGALSIASASNIVSALGTTAVNRATGDASGNNIASTYAKKVDVQKQHTYINVLDYGAKGDGTTDDTQAFKNAFAAASPGSHIVIPFGGGETYKITTYIELRSNFVTVRGEGAPNLSWESHGIKFVPATDTAVCFRVYGSGCTFENLIISTDNSDHAHKGIGIYAKVDNLPDVDLEVINCKFVSLKHGIYHYNRGCLVKNSSFAICEHGVSIAADNLITSTDLQRALRIEGNRFHMCSIGVWVSQNAAPYYMVISDNYVELPWGSSTDNESNCLLYASCDFNGLTITNNTVADPRLHAIYIGGSALKFTMAGNNIFSYSQNSSYTVRIVTVDNFTISSNTIVGAYHYALYFDTARSGSITGNFILGRVQTSSYGCVLINTKIYRVTISGNSFTLWNADGGYAVRYGGTEALTYFVMQGNVCNGNMFQNVNNVSLSHNSIQSNL